MSILKKIVVFYVFIAVLLGGSLYFFLNIYSNKTDKQTYIQTQHDLKSLINERMELKKQFGIPTAISIANDIRLAKALQENNRTLAINVLKRISKKLSQSGMPDKIKLHIHTKNNKSFVRLWKLDKYGDDLSSFRSTVVSVNANHKNIHSFEVGRVGLVLRSLVPIENTKKAYLGSLEVIHGIDSIVHKFAENKDGLLLLMDENLTIKAFKKANKLFHYNISQKFIQNFFLEDARNIDMKALLKDGYFMGKQYYFTYKDILDFKGNKLGIYLLGRSLHVVQNTINEKKNLIHLALFISLGILVLVLLASSIGLNILILTPLRKIDEGISSFFNYLQKKSSKVNKIEIDSKDEFGEIAHSINENIVVSKRLHEEIYELNTNLEKKVQERTQALEKEQEQLTAIYNGSKDAIAILDMESNFLKVNREYTQMTGFSEAELLASSCIALTRDEHIEASKEAMKEVLKVGYIKNFEKQCRIKNDDFITVNMSMSLLENPQRVLVSVRDVTQLKAVEKAKSEFLSNMSHEIRTPLNAILGFVSILKKRTSEKKSLEYLDIIDSSGNSLLTIINDILDFSKIQSGSFTIDKFTLDCVQEFHITVMLFSAKAKEKNITYDVVIDQNVPQMIKADGVRIKQIVANLLSNAIKFTPQDGKIKVSLHYEKPNIIFVVQDSGIGISKENQEKIFLAFKQADNSTTRQFGGTGLGLSISASLAKLMNGTLQVNSIEGKGSTFTLTLPIEVMQVEQVKNKTNTQVVEEEIHLKGHILVAEDNKTNQALIKILLSDYGITYVIANDGLEAVKIFKESQFDMVLMDENMPHLNGLEAMAQIKAYEKEKRTISTPIIALTANALSTDREKFLNAGMDGFLTKPIDTKELVLELSKYLVKK